MSFEVDFTIGDRITSDHIEGVDRLVKIIKAKDEKIQSILSMLDPGDPPCNCVYMNGCENSQLCDKASSVGDWKKRLVLFHRAQKGA